MGTARSPVRRGSAPFGLALASPSLSPFANPGSPPPEEVTLPPHPASKEADRQPTHVRRSAFPRKRDVNKDIS